MSLRRPGIVHAVLALVAIPLWGAASTAAAQRTPPALRGIGVDEHPGQALPLDQKLVDEAGRTVPLGRFFPSGESSPVLLVPGYFRCRMLCGVLAPRLYQALQSVDGWEPGRDYRVILFSIDPREGPDDAAARRKQALDADARGWTLLTGSEESVKTLASAVGFQYRYDPTTDQYAHAAIVVAVSPDGSIARYLYGVNPSPDSLGVALAAARDHESAGSLEQVLLLCFRFNPALRRHAGLLANVLRGGAVAILLGLAGVFVFAARRAVGTGSRAA